MIHTVCNQVGWHEMPLFSELPTSLFFHLFEYLGRCLCVDHQLMIGPTDKTHFMVLVATNVSVEMLNSAV